MAVCLIEKNKKVLIFKKIDQISEFVIKKWIEFSKKSIKARGRFVVAISAGKTPLLVYQKLASTKHVLPWKKIHIFLCDERFVAIDNQESNYKSIKENLLDRVNIQKQNIHSVDILKDSKTSAKKYEQKIKIFFHLRKRHLPRFDLVMLGIGEDGHIASLFPHTFVLREKKHIAVAAKYRKAKYQRVSLSLPAINNARNIIFLVTGKNKAKVLKEVLQSKKVLLPASLVRPKNGQMFFLIDKYAGSHF